MVALTLLDDGSFCQSSSGAPPATNKGSSSRKSGARSDKGSSKGSASVKGDLISIISKNKVVEKVHYQNLHDKVSKKWKEARKAKSANTSNC